MYTSRLKHLVDTGNYPFYFLIWQEKINNSDSASYDVKRSKTEG